MKELSNRHPAVLVTAGFFFIYLTQLSEGRMLMALSVGMSVVALVVARVHWWRVVRRLKYVALTIAILFAWQTPGIQVLPMLEAFSPTYDGLVLALPPLLRLLAVTGVVAVLKEALSPNEWVSSLYVLAWPLEFVGLSRERLAIRLRLVLDYVEETELDWRALLKTAPDGEDAHAIAHCEVLPISTPDRILVALILLLALWMGFR